MNIRLILISTFLFNLNAMGQDAPNCNTAAMQYTNAFEWEEREMCMDPYKTICENDSTNENFQKRSLAYTYHIAQEAGDNIYQANKAILNSKGVTEINMFNYNKILKQYESACINDKNIECRSDKVEFSRDMPDLYEMEIEEQVTEEFYRLMDQSLDSKIDHLHTAFQLQQERLIEIAKQELKGKLSPVEIEETVYQLRVTKGVFSTSDKSMNLNFPFLTTREQQQIKDEFRMFCYDNLKPVHNAAFMTARFRSQQYNITFYCPSDYIGGLEDADTLNSVYRSLAFLVGHELGHQISMRIKNLGVFDQFNKCMKNNFAVGEILGHHHNYHNEAQADFWGKKLVGEILKDLKDLPVEERILFIKETATILCGAPDDMIHHASEHRLNLALRLTPEFRNAFRCSRYSDQMRLQKPINCQLDGEHYIMIPEL